MSFLQRRLISSVSYLNNAYAASPDMQQYIRYALTKYCASSGLDARGAERAEIPGGCHSGGKTASEDFHLTFRAIRTDGSLVPTINPHTKQITYAHHFYIAPNQQGLEADMAQWVMNGRPLP